MSGSENSFVTPNTPKCVENGKAQFERVEVLDQHGGKITSANWVVANLWWVDGPITRRPRAVL